MKPIQEKLEIVERHVNSGNVTIMIMGLGSVGTYLLDYLVSMCDPAIKIVVVGRNYEKIEQSVNIIRVAALIRNLNKTHILIEAGVDFDNINAIEEIIKKHSPDFIVNSSRAYPGLKYGSISWTNVRAYGLWTPLAIRLIKNIMDAYNNAESEAIVINTSYSDAVIAWLKSAGRPYPDFGSGNLNHLVPRIKFAVADMLGVEDFWNIEIMFAAGHFHDVCISKEGHAEGVNLPLKIYYNGKEQSLPHDKIYADCKIPMPVDAQRNMMNASSNFQIITAIIETIRSKCERLFYSPGVFGNLGGYPVRVGYRNGKINAWIDESVFCFKEMNAANKQSMYLDGVENIKNGKLIYTDELINNVINKFGVKLPKIVEYSEIEDVASFIIDKIIIPQTNHK